MHLGRRFARGEYDFPLRASRWSNLDAGLGSQGVASRPSALLGRMQRLVHRVRELGPYAAIALLLPGGSLIALALLSRRRRAPITFPLLRTLVAIALVGASLVLPGST